jgi:hypothetical protein
MLSSNLSSERPARSTRHLRSPSQPHHAASPFPVNLGYGAGRVAIRSRSSARPRVAESPRESAYGRCLSSRSETVEPGGICNVTIACSICEYARSVRLSLRLVHRICISDCRKMDRLLTPNMPFCYDLPPKGFNQKRNIAIGFSQQPRSDVTI